MLIHICVYYIFFKSIVCVVLGLTKSSITTVVSASVTCTTSNFFVLKVNASFHGLWHTDNPIEDGERERRKQT
jgi:hypothetical protein